RVSYPSSVPAVLWEYHDLGSLILGCIAVVYAGDSDDSSAPTAEDQARVRCLHRKGQPAQEIVPIDPQRLQLDLIIGPRHVLRPVESAKSRLRPNNNSRSSSAKRLVDRHRASTRKIGHLPAGEGLAFEEACPGLCIRFSLSSLY